MERRANFLALCLLDALEDEDPRMIEDILSKYVVNPNVLIQERGIAPMHYACGMPNVELAEKVTAQLLKRGGDPNVRSIDNMTPLHVAALHGRENIVKMLLKCGGKLDMLDNDRQTPILYAIHECHFDVVKVMQNHIFERKYQKKHQDLSECPSPRPIINNHLAVKNLEETKFTPNRINYNYDVTSPYYINITHRRKREPCKCCPPKDDNYEVIEIKEKEKKEKQNIFALTKENISEFSKELSSVPTPSPMSLIQIWREKVQRAKSKQSILQKFNDIDSLLGGIIENDNLDFTNTVLEPKSETENKDVQKNQKPKSFNTTGFGKLVKTLEEIPTEVENDSFHTVPDFDDDKVPQAQSTQINESNFIRSPRSSDYIVQMAEAYVHTDDENGLVFFETKIRNNPVNQETPHRNHNVTNSSLSTNLTVPLDYETDALRAELTNFGDPPGPITNTTKKLYIKRLTKYKRHTALMQAQLNANQENRTKFSVELTRTIQRKDSFDRIPDYNKFEREVVSYFQNCANVKNLREGHLKHSFIYLLIDPRLSNNLPGESSFMTQFDSWKRFLRSIFYVGKGKSSRPYSHLYDAMKKFTKMPDQEKNILRAKYPEAPKTPGKESAESKKLNRIIDIWTEKKGVVCLHVFHNILPSEAYTREASIIDAMSLQHLTNMKRGDYYGPAKSWTMRARKCLGVVLLFKAMQIYLAEGESQLSPNDLL